MTRLSLSAPPGGGCCIRGLDALGLRGDSGIMAKWADKYGIEVEILQINDYIESINQYTAGAFDGCVMTNMDALTTIPAAGGVDSTALIVGDFSNGNDGIVTKSGESVAALEGERVNLVELSVSHYLLARALDRYDLAERDLTVVNTSDADILSAFTGSADVVTVVTWNPQLSEVVKVPGAAKVFDKTAEIALDLAWKDVDAVYLSFDIDCVDCGFVPGTGWPEPGGFLPREIRIEESYRVGAAAPGFGSRELVHHVLPGALVERRKRLVLVYVSADGARELGLAEAWQRLNAAVGPENQ